MSAQFTITHGAARTFAIQCWIQGGRAQATFAPTDTFTCEVYRGQDQATLITPTVGFYTGTPPGSQTGYDQGQLQIAITAAQSATFEAEGSYYGQVWNTQQTAVVADFTLFVESAPGAILQPIQPYCTYQDLLLYADWIKMIQRKDDLEGFYSQRLQAREWLDQLIIGQWRGTGYVPFGEPTLPASMWSGGFIGRTPLTSQWLRNELAGGFFTVPQITITAGGSYAAAPAVSVAPPPPGPGVMQATFACTIDATGRVTAIWVTNAGQGYAPGMTYPLTFTGSGTGAAATATTSTGALIVRPEIVRACAWKAISYIGQGQIGGGNYQSLGYWFSAEADREVLSMTAELDLTGQGLGQLAVPLGGAQFFFT